jgi:hypothetical protein
MLLGDGCQAVGVVRYLLNGDVDRSMAEFEECRLEWTRFLIGTIRRWGTRF